MQGQRSRFSHQEESRSQRAGNGLHGVTEWAHEHIDQQPMASLFTAFAAGFAVGIGAVAAYCAAESQAHSRHSDRLTDRINELIQKNLPSNLASMWRS